MAFEIRLDKNGISLKLLGLENNFEEVGAL